MSRLLTPDTLRERVRVTREKLVNSVEAYGISRTFDRYLLRSIFFTLAVLDAVDELHDQVLRTQQKVINCVEVGIGNDVLMVRYLLREVSLDLLLMEEQLQEMEEGSRPRSKREREAK